MTLEIFDTENMWPVLLSEDILETGDSEQVYSSITTVAMTSLNVDLYD